jgi:hypothetical protein
MSPADITSSAEFRVGLERRLAELGLIPPQTAAVKTLPDAPDKRGDLKAA